MPFKKIGDTIDVQVQHLLSDERRIEEALEGSGWRYDEGYIEFHGHYKGAVYAIYVEDIGDANTALRWISTINSKSWATPKVVGDFVKLLDAVLGLRSIIVGDVPAR